MRKMRPIATDVARSVVRVSVCLFVYLCVGIRVFVCVCAKMAHWIEMPFGKLTHVGPKNHHSLLSKSDESTRSDKTAMRPVAKLFWKLAIIIPLVKWTEKLQPELLIYQYTKFGSDICNSN